VWGLDTNVGTSTGTCHRKGKKIVGGGGRWGKKTNFQIGEGKRVGVAV